MFQVRRTFSAGKQCPEHDLPSLVISQSAEQIAELCRGLNSTHANSMEVPTESHDPSPRPLARHLSDADRLRKVIQELVDTEKSYVKVMVGMRTPLLMMSLWQRSEMASAWDICHSGCRPVLLEVDCCREGRAG